jgi:hypothetical protein
MTTKAMNPKSIADVRRALARRQNPMIKKIPQNASIQGRTIARKKEVS